jgi:hypothetical protein
VALDVEVLPYNERFHSAQLQCLKGVLDTEAIFARVHADLVEVVLNQLLLLHELDIRQGLRGELDSLVEAVLATVGDVDGLDDLRTETGVEEVALPELRLEVGRASKHEAGNVHLVVGNEVLDSVLGDLADIVVPLLVAQTRETERGLSTTAVLLREVDGELVNDLTGVTGKGAEESAVAVHDYEAKAGIGLKELREGFGVELIVAKVE